jgi:hypothetical protein
MSTFNNLCHVPMSTPSIYSRIVSSVVIAIIGTNFSRSRRFRRHGVIQFDADELRTMKIIFHDDDTAGSVDVELAGVTHFHPGVVDTYEAVRRLLRGQVVGRSLRRRLTFESTSTSTLDEDNIATTSV